VPHLTPLQLALAARITPPEIIVLLWGIHQLLVVTVVAVRAQTDLVVGLAAVVLAMQEEVVALVRLELLDKGIVVVPPDLKHTVVVVAAAKALRELL
jgi:hypothetical protein